MSAHETVPTILAHAAAEYSGREAIVDGTTRWTFAQLVAEIRRVAASLIASDVQPGDRVAVWAPNGHRFVLAALGAASVGAVFVPINTRYQGEEAHWILSRSGARLLFVDNGFLNNDYLAKLAAAGPRPDTLSEVVDLSQSARVGVAGALGWEPFLGRGDSVDASEVLARELAVQPDDVADMFFTSGTTGRPKGVLASHGQNIRVYRAWIEGVGLQTSDRYLLVNPMFHTFGWKAGVLACLIRGATLIPQPVFDVDRSLELMAEEAVTVVPGPPTLYASILDHPDFDHYDLTSLRLAVTGASVVPVALVERMRESLFPRVVIAYGLTESCGTATVGDPEADSEAIARTVGKAIPGTEVIVAGVDGRALPAGEAGEVLVRGYNVMHGYFEDPQATAGAIDANGFLHTGDIGVLDGAGNLRITDRLKDMFVVGGFNAYPAEIEQTIARCEKVSEVAVVGVPDERLGEVGRAFVIVRPGAELTEQELIAFCRDRLANFKVPRSVILLDSLPRNASGKVVKSELRSYVGSARTGA